MAQKILLAVDESENSLKAVYYIAKNFNPRDEITLFSVLAHPMAIYDPDSPLFEPIISRDIDAYNKILKIKRDKLNKFLDKSTEILTAAGVSSNNINIKIVDQTNSIAKHILEEAKNGAFDTIVMGRRGSSAFTELLMGSVSHKVILYAKDFAVTIVE